PARLDEHLRLGGDWAPAAPQDLFFRYPHDGGSFAQAASRCVGIGKCRQHEHPSGAVMCPSYQVTMEEEHSTRGRARLLFEMLHGHQDSPIADGWRSAAVRAALDLCLACKGCKGDCPVNVDVATYKAEFLSHYYEGKPRPLSGYSMGLIYWWARLAALAPEVANFFMQAPVLSSIVKTVGGVSAHRAMPKFAPQTFKQWFRQREPRNVGQAQVLLWPDTFNNHFHPETAIAAVEVLEAAGYQVIVPEQSLCCGRPLYDFGFLDQAEALLRQILETLRPQIRAGISIVGLEPSCVSVFRDELINLFPNDEDAKRLSKQAFLLSEFLNKKAEHYTPPKLNRKAVVHGHCHHKAIMRMNDEQALLSQVGLDFHVLDSGCCGMAGAFGFEKDHYDVSIKAGERVLLPAVRKADKETLIIADGFSCREQIEQCTDRKALHIAQVLKMAMDKEKGEFIGRTYPEEEYTRSPRPPMPKIRAAALIGTSALLAAGLGTVVWRLLRKQDNP
ncbi:MAG TPA: heterodisulfide reductase-related iron-sulfur binding cluster, partial [Ktedonobacteraceae bacterium]|nr:heterodisulfide reductase-related iron-sulfur binding cluster [Ktedonobacteraceae bacterium]